MKISNIEEIIKLLPTKIYTREIHNELFNHLFQEEVTVLYGARQVGKSTEILLSIKELLEKDPSYEIFYYNLDQIPIEFSSAETFYQYLLNHKDPNKKTLVLIDEAQRLENIGLFIKYIYDKKDAIKFVLTGSASLDILEKIKEPLTGRKREFFMYPLSLQEVLMAKEINLSKNIIYTEEIDQIIEEYLLFGGYPKIISYSDPISKIEALKELSESYILKDVTKLFKIQSEENMVLISTFLAENIGNLLSKDSISKYTAISKFEIEKIIYSLRKTFVMWLCYPFAKDRTKELIHRPKVYFYDNGIRNALLGKFNPIQIINDKGALFENTLGNHLKPKYKHVKYWQKQNKTEIDFVCEKEDLRLDIYEAKYNPIKSLSTPAMKSFLITYADLVDNSKVVSKTNILG